MASQLYKVSVPGSMMLLGEHAVLAGKQAVVAAVDKRLHMELTSNTSNQVTITDTRLGVMTQNINELQVLDPYKFVCRAILEFKAEIKTGFNLNINSEFSSVIGLGSSAAVTVATVAILSQWLYPEPYTPDQIFTLAKKIMLEVQGSGSGADLAASVFGGVINYTMQPCTYNSLPVIPNLTAVYCGYKKPTPEVIQLVATAAQQQPQLFAEIFAKINIIVQQAKVAIQQQDWQELGLLFNQHHELQQRLGVSDKLLNTLVDKLIDQDTIYGAKISGSGLGDCVIGLGELPQQIFAQQNGVVQFPVKIDLQGLIYASN
jgi:mevalonate kinase